MTSHGLLLDSPAPSRELLEEWLDQHSIARGESLRIAEMENGEGWRLISECDMELGDLICAIPKTSILSHKTSSLPPISLDTLDLDETSMNAVTILHLSLCLLHEFRLGQQSPFYGYIQSLPREIIGLPIFWQLDEVCGKDGKLARNWLKGTEVEREMRSRKEQGLGLSNIQRFYSTFASHLPPTPLHPNPSPIISFYHCFSLVSSRAFMIDIYHLIGLCPFADILNHSSTESHTSLSSDDFVCHQCGSLKTCQHDITNNQGNSYRLTHLDIKDIQRIESDEYDTVELLVEEPITKGKEIFNSYGDDIGDSKLLVEWGFITQDFTGEGLIWDSDQLDLEGISAEEMEENWEIIDLVIEQLKIHDKSDSAGDEDEKILCERSERDAELLNLDQSGRVSINIFALLWLNHSLYNKPRTNGTHPSEPTTENKESVANSLSKAIVELERFWRVLNSEETKVHMRLDKVVLKVAKQVQVLLKKRLDQIYKSDLSQDELFDLRDALNAADKYQNMAMSLSINERVLLHSALDKWNDLLAEAGF